MNCFKCIKRIFWGTETEEEKEEFIEYKPAITEIYKNQESNKNTPFTITDLSGTSTFKAINEWSISDN